jgi:prevent-host-death family protein
MCKKSGPFSDGSYKDWNMRISITEAKRDLENLIDRAHRGEEIIICRWNRPVVRLEGLPPSDKIKNQSWRRIAGWLLRKISASPDAF